MIVFDAAGRDHLEVRRSAEANIGSVHTVVMIARLSGIVIVCPEPQRLAPFYEVVLGATRSHDADDWVTLAPSAGGPTISLQRVERPIFGRTGHRPTHHNNCTSICWWTM